jgi:hypothetical protein
MSCAARLLLRGIEDESSAKIAADKVLNEFCERA